jgi:hypothetical protein
MTENSVTVNELLQIEELDAKIAPGGFDPMTLD